MTAAEHYPGCHPGHDEGSRDVPEGYQAQETEPCWHCGMPVPHGCNCVECWDNAYYVPPTAVYHCQVCGRWWAWMTGLNITEITFGMQDE